MKPSHVPPMGFSLELWPATSDARGPAETWRGRVLHHASGSVCYFQDWTGLVAVIQDLLGLSGPADIVAEDPTVSPI